MTVRSSEWLDLMRREYLRRFIPGGGSAIKFLMGDDISLSNIQREIQDIAQAGGFHFVAVDAASTKIHMVQDVFFAISRSVDWESLAQVWVEGVFKRNRYSWPRPGERAALREVAEANDIDEILLWKDFQKWLSRDILNENRLAQDFRSALANLCQRRLEGDAVAAAPALDWLRGDLRTIGPVRQVPINAKITRHNGHIMLRSLCHWVRMCGGRGIVATLDIRQLGRDRAAAGDGVKFGPVAVLDAYEVLRQLIDDAENFQGLFLTVLADPSFRDDDSRRAVARYPALQQRIWPDVHARGHENPLTPLLHIVESADSRPDEPLAMPFNEERVAIEALRAGVPNRAAIRQLGSDEKALCDRFLTKLERSGRGLKTGEAVRGEMVAGTFGSGKSHLLGFLAEQALRENYIVSVVPISKQTPLFDHSRVYAAAVRSAMVPGKIDDVMTVVLDRLGSGSDALTELEEWAGLESSSLSGLFPALLNLLPRQTMQPEDKAAIARFLGGAPISVSRVRQWLRAAGVAKLFPIGSTRAPELALQRLRFAPHLFAAAGYAGWCIMLDETDLIGRYSTLQRGRSYAELCRWLNLDTSIALPGVVSVAAITSDFAEELLHRRLDQEKIPALLRAKGMEHQLRLAEIGMLFIEREATELRPPNEERLHRSLDRVRHLYAESYGWPAYGGDIGERRAGRTMREYIKAWVTAWDIYRLYGAEDEIDTETIASDYTENTEFERAPAEESSEGEPA